MTGSLAEKLPQGANLKNYAGAAPGSSEAVALSDAQAAAGPEILNTTLVIPIILIVAFAGLVIYMRGRRRAAGAYAGKCLNLLLFIIEQGRLIYFVNFLF